jgi:threonine/homoserine/homoserine lactone efflux protein
MTIETFVALLVFLLPLAYSPGPGNAFFAAIGASRGVRAAVPALAGYHVATLIVTALIGAGLGVTVLNNPVLASSLAIAGSLYVLWLAWGFIRSARATIPADTAPNDTAPNDTVPNDTVPNDTTPGETGLADPSSPTSAATPTRRPIGFWSGAVVLLLNPKAYYIIAAMFTQFLRPPATDDVGTVLAIAVIFTVNNLVAFLVWTFAGRTLTVLFRSTRSQRVIDYLFAATLAAVAVWMLVPLFAR